jgi:hypothetical protein
MLITAEGKRIKATWPRYDRATHDEIIRRLKSIGAEFDCEQSCWWIDPLKADKLLELFWNASFDYAVICAATDAQESRDGAFCKFLASHAIELRYDAQGGCTAVGRGVSPLLQQVVSERFGKSEAKLEQGRLIV